MKPKLLAVVLLLAALGAAAQGPMDTHPTKYDWSDLAAGIVRGKTSAYDRAYAIYRWLCDNIAYDTTYSIHDADTAFEQKRGVCQAYCELFWQLAKPLGIEAHIISGKSKDNKGKIGERGHAWLFVFTDGNKGILIDPTWGAGSVDGNRFTRKDGDDSWFHVDPKWMIFTHFPDEAEYQLLDTPISYESFVLLAPHRPVLQYFGFDSAEVFDSSIAGNAPELPECYYKKGVDILKVPHQANLKVGRKYDFIVRNSAKYDFAIINEDDWSKEWISTERQHGMHVVPSTAGTLSLSYRDKGSKGEWTSVIEYRVDKPTAADIEALESLFPEKSPVLQTLGNYHPNILKDKGVDMAFLLAEVKSKGISRLPNISSEGKFSFTGMPLDGDLEAGKSYTFRFAPYQAGEWVLVNNDDWYNTWSQDPDNRAWTMTLDKVKKGTLKLGYKPADSTTNTYSIFVEYTVK